MNSRELEAMKKEGLATLSRLIAHANTGTLHRAEARAKELEVLTVKVLEIAKQQKLVNKLHKLFGTVN